VTHVITAVAVWSGYRGSKAVGGIQDDELARCACRRGGVETT